MGVGGPCNADWGLRAADNWDWLYEEKAGRLANCNFDRSVAKVISESQWQVEVCLRETMAPLLEGPADDFEPS